MKYHPEMWAALGFWRTIQWLNQRSAENERRIAAEMVRWYRGGVNVQ
jgi:hypothetical protein